MCSGIDSQYSSVFEKLGSTSKITPRNGYTRWRTTWPIVNLASRVLITRRIYTPRSDWKANVVTQDVSATVVFRAPATLATVASKSGATGKSAPAKDG